MITPQPRHLELLDGDPLAVATASTDDADVARALREAGVRIVAGAADLDVRVRPAAGEAYTLETGGGLATIAGCVHYGAQTLRQLLRDGRLPAVRVEDHPELAIRGVIEGFYGPPWSHRERLDLLRFCARHKLNTFVYAPKDDPYHRESWRLPYPQAELERLRELVEEAQRQHVELAWCVAPGLSVRYAAEDELAALCAKAEQLWGIGVRSFQLLYDDVADELRGEEDAAAFGADASPSAAGQAHFSNRFLREWLAEREGARALVVCPIEYHGTHTSPYRERLAELLDPSVVVYWTGPEVVPAAITKAESEAAAAVLRHDLLLWDNYPVNDFEPSRLFLGPLCGREPGLEVAGLIANGMIQAAPSKVAFATSADWAWNSAGYEAQHSFELALREVGGAAAADLRVFADANRSSILGEADRYDRGAAGEVAERLARTLDDAYFLQAAEPWLDAFADGSRPRYARVAAGIAAPEPLPERDDVVFVATREQATAARGSTLPVIAWDGFRELGMTDETAASTAWIFLDDVVRVVDPAHPLAGIREGIVKVYRGPGRLRFGRPSEAAHVVAVAGDPPRPVLFVYEAGAQMPGGLAPARRIGIFLGPEALDPSLLAPAGRRLFEAAVRYAVS